MIKRDEKGRWVKGISKGQFSPRWKNGCSMSVGYKIVRAEGHPKAKKRGFYVGEHILVMEKRLGRYLRDGEVVHHKDGNKLNNRIENLQLFDNNGNHLKLHLRKYLYVDKLPAPTNTKEIIVKRSKDGQARQYKIRKCVLCNKLFWTYKSRNIIHCSISCGRINYWKQRRKDE